MTTLQFQCPQCTGLFQTDSSFAGQSVACPMCGVGVALPPLEMVAPPGHFQPPPSGMPLACPVCSGGFMIPPELAGQQVACPHCHSPVIVPGGNQPPAPQQPPPPMHPPGQPPVGPPFGSLPGGVRPAEPKIEITGPAQPSLYPPGFEPPSTRPAAPSSPVSSAPVSRPASPPANPAPRVEASSMYPPGMAPPSKSARTPSGTPSTPADNRFPPGFAPQKPASSPPPERPKPAEPASIDNRLPPGASPKKPAEPAPRSSAPFNTPAPSAAPRGKIDDLLPPGAEESDSLLPPGSGSPVPQSSAVAPLRPVAASPSVDDALLPPGMGDVVTSGPLQQVALPEEEMARQLKALNRPLPPTNIPKDAVVIETEEGEYVALREPVKTIGKGAEERELRVLSPEVKQRRRLIRNVVVYAVLFTILVVTFMMLTRL